MLPWKLKVLAPNCSETSCMNASWPPACSQQNQALLCTNAGIVMVQVRCTRRQFDMRGLGLAYLGPAPADRGSYIQSCFGVRTGCLGLIELA